MFQINKLLPEYKNLLGWKPHFDSSIVIDPDLEVSDSGQYYGSKNPALRLDYIKSTLSKDQDISIYLSQKVEDAISTIFNDLIQYRQVSEYGKTLLEQSQLLNRYSWQADKIVNQNRFVGLQIKPRDQTALQVLINEIGLQVDGAQTVTLYLFHSQKEDPLQTIEITTTDSAWKWKLANIELSSISPEMFHGGVFVLGYYQDDLTTQAINYSNFDWEKGECRGCNNSYYAKWQSIRQHFHIFPLYVPNTSYTTGKMFDLGQAFYEKDTSWGLNLKLTVKCDLTDFFIQNKFAFVNLLSLKVNHQILNDMKFSQETNYVQENLKNMVIRDLEGDKETNALNIAIQYKQELKAVNFNISSINNRCLDQFSDTYQPVIGVL